MNVLIVAKTKLGYGVCVGGLDANQRSVRLYEPGWRFPAATTQYEIGQLWDMELEERQETEPPHVEDTLVVRRRFIRDVGNVKAYLLRRIEPWTGPITQLFEGKLGFTGGGRGFIQRPRLPTRSTWFWSPDAPLKARRNGKAKVYYRYRDQYEISYVGVGDAIDTIPTNALVRLSLARWWRPPDAAQDFPYRCYLQVSGWYL
jgi:hypothetical protein